MTSFVCKTTILVFELMAAPPIFLFIAYYRSKKNIPDKFNGFHWNLKGIHDKMDSERRKKTYHEHKKTI